MLLHDAEKQDATIDAEVSFMENYKALEEIKRIEEEKEEINLPSMVNKISNKVGVDKLMSSDDENWIKTSDLIGKRRNKTAECRE